VSSGCFLFDFFPWERNDNLNIPPKVSHQTTRPVLRTKKSPNLKKIWIFKENGFFFVTANGFFCDSKNGIAWARRKENRPFIGLPNKRTRVFRLFSICFFPWCQNVFEKKNGLNQQTLTNKKTRLQTLRFYYINSQKGKYPRSLVYIKSASHF